MAEVVAARAWGQRLVGDRATAMLGMAARPGESFNLFESICLACRGAAAWHSLNPTSNPIAQGLPRPALVQVCEGIVPLITR